MTAPRPDPNSLAARVYRHVVAPHTYPAPDEDEAQPLLEAALAWQRNEAGRPIHQRRRSSWGINFAWRHEARMTAAEASLNRYLATGSKARDIRTVQVVCAGKDCRSTLVEVFAPPKEKAVYRLRFRWFERLTDSTVGADDEVTRVRFPARDFWLFDELTLTEDNLFLGLLDGSGSEPAPLDHLPAVCRADGLTEVNLDWLWVQHRRHAGRVTAQRAPSAVPFELPK